MLAATSSSSTPIVKKYLVDAQNQYTKFHYFWKQDSVFSQWHMRSITIDSITFSCCEQYMMYQKAKLFRDDDVAQQILKTSSSQKSMKALGRKVKNFSNDIWEANRERIVYEGNYAKFTQHSDLRRTLLENVDCEYVEASPYDAIWGIGLSQDDPKAKRRETWKGLNLLGRVLTQLREDLILESKGQ
ncbi:hypothetical protein C9374_007531 [Naegleria lovaniensis]|uniref:NADAR domain-containing protein n=1 Tax=Naegleria lovaniensis TaxID=51637 RepID=A0AA88KGQ2_NAELO|nr:uncharacterized protein C9374_007531 [Naegleria lovaniensis]KAG2379392.1 hypothetical protein C9374_007531 [Naegleria lovaniensis]